MTVFMDWGIRKRCPVALTHDRARKSLGTFQRSGLVGAPRVSKAPAWRRDAQDLYDLLMIHDLYWPAPAIEWLPWCVHLESQTRQSLLVGTDAGRTDRNYLTLLDVLLPQEENGEFSDNTADEVTQQEQIRVVQRVNHPGPVKRLAFAPQNPNLVATGTITGNILVFNLQRCALEPVSDGHCRPDATLHGHAACCQSVAWSPHQHGLVLSCAIDGRLCLWDVENAEAPAFGDFPVPALRTIEGAHGHFASQSAVFHEDNKSVLASVGLDGRLRIWDTRVANDIPTIDVVAHLGGALCLNFAPRSPWLLATGGKDRHARCWDLRHAEKALSIFSAHEGDVLSIDWKRTGGPGTLATSGADGRVLVWDTRHADHQCHGRAEFLAKGGKSKDWAAPELAFVHAAHGADEGRPVPVTAISWGHGPEHDVLASADCQGELHIWQPSPSALCEHHHTETGFGTPSRPATGQPRASSCPRGGALGPAQRRTRAELGQHGAAGGRMVNRSPVRARGKQFLAHRRVWPPRQWATDWPVQ